jgi:hypothetical protein
MVVSPNLNLGCAQLGEGHFLNLTTARSSLTLVEESQALKKSFSTLPERLSRPIPSAASSSPSDRACRRFRRTSPGRRLNAVLLRYQNHQNGLLGVGDGTLGLAIHSFLLRRVTPLAGSDNETSSSSLMGSTSPAKEVPQASHRNE